MSQENSSRNWCFTAFEEINLIDSCIKYWVCGLEICPTTGKQHLQGYIEFTKTIRIAGVKKIMGSKSVHLENRKGSRTQAIEYCKKDGKWDEWDGRADKPGERTDLENFTEAMREKGLEKAIELQPEVYVKYYKGLEKLDQTWKENENERDLVIYWLYGEPRTGKSRYARDKFKDIFQKPDGGMWFDGYKGQKTLLLEDLDPEELKPSFLQKILDRYPLQVPIKGGYVQANWNTVIITSNYHPSQFKNPGPLQGRLGDMGKIINFPRVA